MSDLLYTVVTRIEPDYEDEFNEWQTVEHCPLLMELPGYRSVIRYQSMDEEHCFNNFWHISAMENFDNPERTVRIHTPWADKLSPLRHRRIDFYVQHGGLESEAPAAELDPRFTFLIIDTYSDALNREWHLTDRYVSRLDQLKKIDGIMDVRLYHAFEGRAKVENLVFYYTSVDYDKLMEGVIPSVENLVPREEYGIERIRYRYMKRWVNEKTAE